jgi:hypothetical protein
LPEPDDLRVGDAAEIVSKLMNRWPELHNEATFEFVKKLIEAANRPGGPFEDELTALEGLREEYLGIHRELKQLGVELRFDNSESTLVLDCSAFNGDATTLAMTMYRLGRNRTLVDSLLGTVYGATAHYHNSVKGGGVRSAQGAANATAVREELAGLLAERKDARSLSMIALARELKPRLADAGESLEIPSIRRHISKFFEDIISCSNEPDVVYLAPPLKIAAILTRRRGSPGFTEQTVKKALDLPE